MGVTKAWKTGGNLKLSGLLEERDAPVPEKEVRLGIAVTRFGCFEMKRRADGVKCAGEQAVARSLKPEEERRAVESWCLPELSVSSMLQSLSLSDLGPPWVRNDVPGTAGGRR